MLSFKVSSTLYFLKVGVLEYFGGTQHCAGSLNCLAVRLH